MKNYLSFQQIIALSKEKQNPLCFKWAYVKNEFRFIQLFYKESHRQLVGDDEQATAAGTLVLGKNNWRSTVLGSQTLGVGCDEPTEAALAELFTKSGYENLGFW